jgi:hypothetical protein
VSAFVCWEEVGWPPSNRDAEVLASALADLFEVSMFESFLALVAAESDDARRRFLRLAGATDDLISRVPAEGADESEDEAPTEDPSMNIVSAPGADPEDVPASQEAMERKAPVTAGTIPLWQPEDLLLDGVTSILSGKMIDGQGRGTELQKRQAESANRGGGYGSMATDLDELNRLGMAIAVAYEQRRLRQGGAEPTDAIACVVDVSTPETVRVAMARSQSIAAAFDQLKSAGLAVETPGFDILTLDPKNNQIDRLIELKSSGVNAAVQAMTWNEWKTARDSEWRERFWLYLVGNLRSDLAAARPFVRAVRDPFGALLSTIVTAPIRRSVQLDTRQFERAEFLELSVQREKATK